MLFSLRVFAYDTLSIISPHRKSIQKEIIPVFEKHYKKKFGKKVRVDWIDQGGTENDLRFIINRFNKNPKTSSIDIFWGGGEVTFYDLEKRNLLEQYKLPHKLNKKLPHKLSNLNLRSEKNFWYATALSSFGIFYNKKILKLLKMPEPQTWYDLSNTEYFEYISIADPRQSSSSLMMSLIMFYSLGWDKGWKLLSALAGNTRKFTHSSSDPIKAIITGDAAIATAIDFYASPKVSAIGHNNLGFVLPKNATIFNCDPVAILKGAPQRKVAQRFINFILSKEAQSILIYPKGVPGGPKYSTLGRISILPEVYQVQQTKSLKLLNPFTEKNMDFKLDMNNIVKTKKILSEAIGTIHVDLHHSLQNAWKSLIKTPDKEKEKLFFTAPFTEEDMKNYRENWNNTLFRSKIKNTWIVEAKKKYQKILTTAKM